jgi:N-acetylglucosamine-6-sulfatase
VLRTRTATLLVLAAAMAAAAALPSAARSTGAAGLGAIASRPNVLVVLVDDATVADIARLPNVQGLIAAEGTTFARTYSPDPLCCPARATILTGEYPHNHRVLDNVWPNGGFPAFDDSSTLATWLDADYRTGLFGKYLNDNGSQRSYVPPGWDTFKIPVQHDTYDYVGPQMWVDGRLRSFPFRDATTLYAQQARDFVGRAVEAGDPFFAYLALVAPHAGRPHDDYPKDPAASPWVPAPFRHTEPRIPIADPGVNEVDVSDKPSYVRDRPLLSRRDLHRIDERAAQARESLKAVDEQVGLLIGRLADLGVLDDTYIVFASDNGYMNGQHRIGRGKAVTYEPSARVPLVVRGPGFPAGAVYRRVSGLQDVAPTVLDVARESAPTPRDGVSLLDLASGRVRTGRPELLEIPVSAGLSDNAVQRGARPSPAQARRLAPVSWFARGIVTSAGWKFVRYPQTGERELYDLDTDPYELDNLADQAAYRSRAASMAARLREWQSCVGGACH